MEEDKLASLKTIDFNKKSESSPMADPEDERFCLDLNAQSQKIKHLPPLQTPPPSQYLDLLIFSGAPKHFIKGSGSLKKEKGGKKKKCSSINEDDQIYRKTYNLNALINFTRPLKQELFERIEKERELNQESRQTIKLIQQVLDKGTKKNYENFLQRASQNNVLKSILSDLFQEEGYKQNVRNLLKKHRSRAKNVERIIDLIPCLRKGLNSGGKVGNLSRKTS